MIKPVIIETTRELKDWNGEGVHLPKGYRHMVLPLLAERRVKTGDWKYSDYKVTQEQIAVSEHKAQKDLENPAVVNHNYIISASPNDTEPAQEPVKTSRLSKGVRDTC